MMKQLQPLLKRTRVVCLIGMDGSGKTTHSRRIIDHLQESGIKCHYVWFGNAYFFSYPFMMICRMLGLTTTHHLANGLAVSEHEYYKNKSVSLTWPWVQFLDAAIFVNLRVRLPLWRGLTVVCDRFIPDILVELMTDINDDRLYEKIVGRLMLMLMPRSLIVVLMDVDEKTAWRRKNDVPELKFLSSRRRRYCMISHDLKIPRVNAEEPFVTVQKHLLSLIDGSNGRMGPLLE